jgi:hypothetical protein
LVAHTQARRLSPADLLALTPARLILDTVNGWSSPDWAAAGFVVRRLGDGKQAAVKQ